MVRRHLNIDRAPGPWFNIKMSSYWYTKSHFGDKMVVRLSYLHSGTSYTGKTVSLYWIRPWHCPVDIVCETLRIILTKILIRVNWLWPSDAIWCHKYQSRLTHLRVYASVNWVSIGPGNGLSPFRCQAITWTSAGLLSVGLLGNFFSEIQIRIPSILFKKMHLKLSSAKMAAILSRGRWVKLHCKNKC